MAHRHVHAHTLTAERISGYIPSSSKLGICCKYVVMHTKMYTHAAQVSLHVTHSQVQDMTQSTIALLRYISAITPATSGRGFVFAGDSAQTIARGINFRFQALRSVLLRATPWIVCKPCA